MFDTGEGQKEEIIDTLQPLVLLFFGYDTERVGRTNCSGGWLGKVALNMFVDTYNPLSHINCLTMMCST